jgi:hypothetical protein
MVGLKPRTNADKLAMSEFLRGIAMSITQAAFTPEPATDDEYAAFSAWAMPYVWSSDKAAMDLAYIAWRAGCSHAGAPRAD